MGQLGPKILNNQRTNAKNADKSRTSRGQVADKSPLGLGLGFCAWGACVWLMLLLLLLLLFLFLLLLLLRLPSNKPKKCRGGASGSMRLFVPGGPVFG